MPTDGPGQPAEPEFVRYRIPDVTIDGANFNDGEEVVVDLHCRVVALEHPDGTATRRLRIVDWAGPRRQPVDPGEPTALRERVDRLSALHGATRAINALRIAADGLGELAQLDDDDGGPAARKARALLLQVAEALAVEEPGPFDHVDSLGPTES